MKPSSSTLLLFVLSSVLGTARAAGDPYPFTIDVLEARTKASLTLDRGAIAALGGGEELNGMIGFTRDFKGQEFMVNVAFSDPVPPAKLRELLASQGRLKGSVQCQRIRLGSTPQIPELKTAVYADGCTIIKALDS